MTAGNFFACDFFALFELPRRFLLDGDALKSRYLSLQAGAHPDVFADKSTAEKLAAGQMAGRINDAFQTLRRPLSRAAYLLSLRGCDVFAETATAMPMDFLAQQIEWREELESARMESSESAAIAATESPSESPQNDKLRRLRESVQKPRDDIIADMPSLLADDKNSDDAVVAVRRWRYLEKMLDDIDALLP